MHPNAKTALAKASRERIYTPEMRQRRSEILKRLWAEGKMFCGPGRLGGRKKPPKRPEAIEKHRQKMLGHAVSLETRKRISLANSGSKNGMFGFKPGEEEIKRLSDLAKRNWKNPTTRGKFEAYMGSEVGKINQRKGAIACQESLKSMGYKGTKPEQVMHSILTALGIRFIHGHPITDIPHRYHCDFYVPGLRLVIEVDGRYWHHYPHGRPLDHIRNKELRDARYQVLRFWEEGFDLPSVREALVRIQGTTIAG